MCIRQNKPIIWPTQYHSDIYIYANCTAEVVFSQNGNSRGIQASTCVITLLTVAFVLTIILAVDRRSLHKHRKIASGRSGI